MLFQFFLVFIVTVLVDWTWGLYIICTAKKQAMKASIFAVMISLMGSYVTMAYMQDKKVLFAVAAGAFVGTYLSIKFSKKEE